MNLRGSTGTEVRPPPPTVRFFGAWDGFLPLVYFLFSQATCLPQNASIQVETGQVLTGSEAARRPAFGRLVIGALLRVRDLSTTTITIMMMMTFTT